MSKRFLRIADTLYHWVFPRVIEPDAETQTLLRNIYPTINWQKVRFYEGLPWFIAGSYVNAIVLPATWNRQYIHAYFAVYQPDTLAGLSTIIHEGFHVLQYQDLGKGIGFMRRFMVFYLADYFQLFFKNIFKKGSQVANRIAYEKHPMEIPAYTQDRYFSQHCLRYKMRIPSTQLPSQLIHTHCGYSPQLAFPFLLMGFLMTLLFMLIKPFIEVFFLIIAAPMYVIGSIF